MNHSVNNNLCYDVLADQKRIIARHSVQAITEHDLATPDKHERLKSSDDDS